MPLETGHWMINANGQVGQLIISSVDPSGNLNRILSIPNFLGLSDIHGFWEETSQKITFNVVNLEPPQVYTGFLFQDQFRIREITGIVVFTLAGYFQILGGTVGFPVTARRHTFGWYAQIGVG